LLGSTDDDDDEYDAWFGRMFDLFVLDFTTGTLTALDYDPVNDVNQCVGKRSFIVTRTSRITLL
jgi:hypothetical protein